jgi:two-component system sensor histidine kinase NreB
MSHILSAQEDERSRISRDLHDGLGQSLTSILLRLRVLEDSATGETERANVAAIRQVTADALADLRRLVHETRPPILEELGLGAALEKQLVDARTASGIDTTLICHGCDDRRLPVAIETALYRVIQEAVTNTLKHAAADHLTVTVTIGPDDVTASVVDDGTGFDVAAVCNDGHRSFGLLGMTERLRPFAGTVTLNSTIRQGTTVTFRIPLLQPEVHS